MKISSIALILVITITLFAIFVFAESFIRGQYTKPIEFQSDDNYHIQGLAISGETRPDFLI